MKNSRPPRHLERISPLLKTPRDDLRRILWVVRREAPIERIDPPLVELLLPRILRRPVLDRDLPLRGHRHSSAPLATRERRHDRALLVRFSYRQPLAPWRRDLAFESDGKGATVTFGRDVDVVDSFAEYNSAEGAWAEMKLKECAELRLSEVRREGGDEETDVLGRRHWRKVGDSWWRDRREKSWGPEDAVVDCCDGFASNENRRVPDRVAVLDLKASEGFRHSCRVQPDECVRLLGSARERADFVLEGEDGRRRGADGEAARDCGDENRRGDVVQVENR